MPNYRIAGIDVSFPFTAYDCQLVYMERVIQSLQQGCNALLESPTGTGKTLCLLCATLAWRESLGASLKARSKLDDIQSRSNLESSQDFAIRKLPTIVYTSRTHSQLQQVIRELKSSAYRPKMVILGSREQMCIHHDIKLLRGRAQNQACRALCKSRSCHHQNRVSEYARSHPEMGDEPFDIEELVSIGKTQGPCPYYLSRELHNSADILFAPYNYMIEKENRRSLTGIHWENTVLIFDEAHNLENICADAASFDIHAAHLSACIMEARQCVDLALAHRNRDHAADTSMDPDNFAILKALLLELEKRINDIPFTSDESGFTRPGPYIYEFLADMKITHETVTMLLDTMDHATNLLEDEANLGSVKMRSSTSYRLQTLRDALRVVFRGTDTSHSACYRFHIHKPYGQDEDKGYRKDTKNTRMLSWWCFNPGIAMEEFSHLGVRSVILTSGTLAPLDSFALELKLPFKVRLENPHVIQPDQIWVGVISCGPSGRSLNSSYRTRDSLEYKLELGNTIVNFARIVPDGLLVFFPSYFLLNLCIEAWQTSTLGASAGSSTVWERICKHKQPVVEPKASALFNYAIEDFASKLNDTTSSGAVFFAVCRGKVSEGLDFADKAGRAVVITGIPFAVKTDPKVRLKREYLDEQAHLQKDKSKTLTGGEWYVQQACRAVNQAVGRVIRHRDDYGAIIFCDERFAQGSAQNQMSLWLRPHVKCYSKFGDAAFTLTRFFRDKGGTNVFKKPLAKNQFVKGAIHKPSGDLTARDILGKGKTISMMSSDMEAQGVLSAQRGKNYGDARFFSQKLSSLSGLHTGLSSDMASTGPQKPLSALLASFRGNSSSNHINTVSVTPANRAIGSDRVVHTLPVPCPVARVKDCIAIDKSCETDSEYEVVDLAIQSPVQQSVVSHVSKDAQIFDEKLHATLNCEKRNTMASKTSHCSSSIPSSSGVNHAENHQNLVHDVFNLCHDSTEMALPSAAAVSGTHSIRSVGDKTLKGKASLTKNAFIQKEDKKTRDAAEFLKEVKARLSSPEYKGFLECMKGLRQQIMSMNTLLETVANLFSAPERIFLLDRFGEFVPIQHKELYERCLAAKRAVVEELSGRHLPGDKVSSRAEAILTESEKCTGLRGFPSRSRKRPATMDSTQT